MIHNRICFLVTLLCLLVVLSGCDGDDEPKPLRVKLVAKDASGLSVGEDVKISGVRVGEVEKLELTEKDRVTVHILISSDERHRVTTDARFRIKRKSLIDERRYIDIDPGSGPQAQEGHSFEVTGFFDGLWDSVHRQWDKLNESVDDAEVQEKLRDFSESLKRAAEKGRQEWERKRPELEREAGKLLEQARDAGVEAIDKLAEDVERLMDEAESAAARKDSLDARGDADSK